jgi:pimeloyl-ACP methyl ester carboxylesterase
VIFQHGGGQSMTNYLSEAFIVARAGVVSVIPDSPAHRGTSGAETQTEVAADERRILDWLVSEPGIDPRRIAYVGHSYGAMAGAALTGIEPPFAAFILLGAVPPEPEPARDLPHARAPILVQCARLDTDANRRGCPEVHRLAGGPKRIVWYDDDHYFTSLEAMRDRLAWLEQYLKLKPLQPEIVKFLKQ